MTQGRDGISLAPEEAAKRSRVAPRFSVIAAILAVASFVVGSAGTGFAQTDAKRNPADINTLDQVFITNYGGAFAGSLSTFNAGSGKKASPALLVSGTNTGMQNSSGPALDAVSSVDGHIAIAIPFDSFGAVDFPAGDKSGCGPFLPAGPANPALIGTGLVEVYSPGSTGNSKPENIICSPGVAFGAPNTTGIDLPQGVAFENPFDKHHPGEDVLAVANGFPVVLEPVGSDDLAICTALMLPTAATGSLGSITEYDRAALPAGINNVPPLNATPSVVVNPVTLAVSTQNVTIGGCLTLMAGPEALEFDAAGNLFVVNNAGNLAAATAALPRYVTVYPPTPLPDQFPIAVIGVGGPTPVGTLLQPVGIAIESGATPAGDIMFVTDTGVVTDQGGNNGSIKVFRPFTNRGIAFFQGELIATITGHATRLRSPGGVALGLHLDNNTLYVVDQRTSSLLMFTDIDATVEGGGGNVPPTLILQGLHSKLRQPIGVALPHQFTPTPTPAPDGVAAE